MYSGSNVLICAEGSPANILPSILFPVRPPYTVLVKSQCTIFKGSIRSNHHISHTVIIKVCHSAITSLTTVFLSFQPTLNSFGLYPLINITLSGSYLILGSNTYFRAFTSHVDIFCFALCVRKFSIFLASTLHGKLW